ncbi:MAG TPA: hypothetical protein DD396_08555, partial [Bacteroidetes bacterium]|nr:hypothetical protein [Bacteroidota bacterium]
KYPDFYDIYVTNIVGGMVKGINSTPDDVSVELYRYIAHRDMDSLYKITQEKFGDFEPYREELQEASKYIALYFPEDTIKKVTTFISTFQYGSVYLQQQKEFGVGLDMYLGADFEVYQIINPENFPAYRVRKFEPYRIVANCVQTYVDYKLEEFNGTTFMDQAIYEGKKLYLLDLLLPEAADSLKINYTEQQMAWVTEQENNMWSYLIEKEVIFNSNKNEFQKHYFNDGPFTTPFGNESAPRTGAWLGWQIVRTYMEKNPNITVYQLLSNKNNQAIFQKSGYRP